MGTRALVGRYTAAAGWEAAYFSSDGHPEHLGQALLDEVRAWRGDLGALLSALLDPGTPAPGGLRNAEFRTDRDPSAPDPLYRHDDGCIGNASYVYLFDVADQRLDVFDNTNTLAEPQAVRFTADGTADVVELRSAAHPCTRAPVVDGWGDESPERRARRVRFADNLSRALGASAQEQAEALFALCEEVICGGPWRTQRHPRPHDSGWRPAWNPVAVATDWYHDGLYDLVLGEVVLHYGGSNTARRCERSPHTHLIRPDGATCDLGRFFHESAEWPESAGALRRLLEVLCRCALEATLGPGASLHGVEWHKDGRSWSMTVWQEVAAAPRPGQLSLTAARALHPDAMLGDALARDELAVVPAWRGWMWLVLDWMRMVARGEAQWPSRRV